MGPFPTFVLTFHSLEFLIPYFLISLFLPPYSLPPCINRSLPTSPNVSFLVQPAEWYKAALAPPRFELDQAAIQFPNMQYTLWSSVLALALGSVASAIPFVEIRDNKSLSDCLTSKNVPIRLSSSPDFVQLSKPFNLRLQYTPAVIVLPTTVRHVQDAVVCASQYGAKVQAKSGGHSYASYSLGGQDGSMTIDLENFQEITLDAQNIAKVGPGVRLGNLALGIYNQNKRALSHGTCPGVGLGGHVTHGGYGYVSRGWGLALDTIVAMDVVLANGSYIHTTSTSYPDIYYVCSCPFNRVKTVDRNSGTSRGGRFFWHRDKVLLGHQTGSDHDHSMVSFTSKNVYVC